MKCSLGISSFLLEISSLSPSIIFLYFFALITQVGEGNGNPLQYFCLENPVDGGAWWALSRGAHRAGHNCSDLAVVACRSLRKAFLFLPGILWNSAFKWVYLSFSPLPFTFLLFSAICEASSDNYFAFLHFFFLGIVLITASCTMSRTSVHSSSGTLFIRSHLHDKKRWKTENQWFKLRA